MSIPTITVDEVQALRASSGRGLMEARKIVWKEKMIDAIRNARSLDALKELMIDVVEKM